MNKTSTILVMLTMTMAALAFVPSASADHGVHDCTEEDPCDNQNNDGCDSNINIGSCEYDGHSNCSDAVYDPYNPENNRPERCYHYTKSCFVSLLRTCYYHGSLLLETPLA